MTKTKTFKEGSGAVIPDGNEYKRCGFYISCKDIETAAEIQRQLKKVNSDTTEFSIGTVCLASMKILGYIELYSDKAMGDFKKILARLKMTRVIDVKLSSEVCSRVKDEFGLDKPTKEIAA